MQRIVRVQIENFQIENKQILSVRIADLTVLTVPT